MKQNLDYKIEKKFLEIFIEDKLIQLLNKNVRANAEVKITVVIHQHGNFMVTSNLNIDNASNYESAYIQIFIIDTNTIIS